MISMTFYWQQFKECIENLQIEVNNEECLRQIEIAKKLIEMGLRIEHLGITEIMQVANQLNELSKLFQNEVLVYSINQEYKFHLPKITNNESLIFAIFYYQHLNNYEQVHYQGVINWFRQKVVEGINEKKITTQIHANELLEKIRQYCQYHNIFVDDSLFLKKNDESVKNYTSRIINFFYTKEVLPDKEEGVFNQVKEMIVLEESLKQLQEQEKQLKDKVDTIEKKIASFNQAAQNHAGLVAKRLNEGFFIRSFYGMISIFRESSETKNINKAKQELEKAVKELNQELIPHIELHLKRLQEQQEQLINTQHNVSNQVIQKKLEISFCSEETKEVQLHAPFKVQSMVFKPKVHMVNLNGSSNNYNFFNHPEKTKNSVWDSIAIAAAAASIHNFIVK